MEEYPIAAPEAVDQPLTLAGAEKQLTALASQLSQQLEDLSQAQATRQTDLDTREADLNRREMAARAREALEDKGLPAALADCLSLSDDDALRTAVDALEEAFRAAVQQAVEKRLLADAPKSSAPVSLSDLSDEDYYAAVCRND